MSTKTYDDFLNGVSNLIDEFVDHELAMRDLTPQAGPVHNKRRQLARVLFDEYIQNRAPAIAAHNLSTDLHLTSHFLTVCQVDLMSSEAIARQKASNTLRHIQYKLSRLACTAQNDMTNCQRLVTLVRVIINSLTPGVYTSTPNTHSTAQSRLNQNQPSQSQQTASSSVPQTVQCSGPSASNANTDAQPNMQTQRDLAREFMSLNVNTSARNENVRHENTSHTYTYTPKLYKWKIQYSGNNKTLGVFEFIQKIEAKAKAYEVTHEQLFQSACELFDGFAAKWFLSQRFHTWNEIKEKLISDFVQVDYLENLLDTIRQRKQAHNEAIVHFFTVFEDDCSRLPVQLTTDEKLNILKKNILQKYRPYVALNKFDSVDEMKHALKVLEMSMCTNNTGSYATENNKYVRFNSSDGSGYSNEYRGRSNSNDRNRSRFDKFQANSQYERRDNNNRSLSNSSHRSGDTNPNTDRKSRPPTPSPRFTSNERPNSFHHRSSSRNSDRSQSNDRQKN